MTTNQGRVLIVDYGLCNLDSVKRVVEVCGGQALSSTDPRELSDATHIILPGVASFADAMTRIRETGWDEALKRTVQQDGIPLIGICLGMQLLATEGIEGSEGQATPGLNLLEGRVVALKKKRAEERVPHMGWNEIAQTKPHPLWADIPSGKDFYFANGFHFEPKNEAVVYGKTDYCGGFVSAVGKGNVFGLQCHPEKSQKAGLQFIRNFLSWDGRGA